MLNIQILVQKLKLFLNIIRLIRTELKLSRRCIQKFISQENPDVIICYFPTDLNNAIKNSSIIFLLFKCFIVIQNQCLKT